MTNERITAIVSKIDELVMEQEFCNAITEAKRVEDVHQLLLNNNVDITLDEVIELTHAGETALQSIPDDAELDMDALSCVVGGVKWGQLAAGTISLAAGCGMVFIGGCVACVPGGQLPSAYVIGIGSVFVAVGVFSIRGALFG